MANRLAENFRKSSETPLISVPLTDFAIGAGFVPLYLADIEGSNVLTSFAISGKVGYIEKAWNVAFDEDFDTPINVPITLKGTGIANVGIQIYNHSGGATSSINRDWTLTLKKVSASGTETNICSTTANVAYTSSLANGAVAGLNIAFQLVIPRTSLSGGEKLRLTVASDTDDAGNCDTRITTDPKARGLSPSAPYEDSTVYIPLEINE